MIIATAGHVDHGKTSLIKWLTGVDTDRLEEEKRRGLSINLGYAYLPRSGGRPLGFIDVPGHQRFINNMIAGISGIDIGMLVIAADDGPMPQTHEHLDVLQLLGISRLVVAISKVDRVTAEQLAAVRRQVDTLLAMRPWPEAVIFPVSNQDGTGIENLKSLLLLYAEDLETRSSAGHFRISIDRAFTTRGAGLVVTGTASSGQVSVGDMLRLLPQGVELRVRGLRVHDEDAEQAMAGQRCAINLAGKLETGAIARGDWLVGAGAAPASHRIDAEVSLLANAPFSVKHLAPVKMYIGARRVAGRLALLDSKTDDNRLHPGGNCLAQLILDSDIACCHGERFLLRDHAENVILGGGTILDPDGPQSGKSRPERIAWLRAMQANSPAAALARLMAQHQLVNIESFRQVWNLRDAEAIGLDEADARLFAADGSKWAASHRLWSDADKRLLQQVDNWHREHSEQPGIKATDLKAVLEEHSKSPLVIATMSARLQCGDLVLREGLISRAGFNPAVSAEEAHQWQRLRQLISDSGHRIPLLSELAAQTGISPPKLELLLKKAVKSGELHCVTDRRYAMSGQLHDLACALMSLADSGEPLTVIAVKSHFGTGRNLTIEILEYFDRIGFTRRHDNSRVILDRELPSGLFRR